MSEILYCVKCEKRTEHKVVVITRSRGFIFECVICGYKKQRNVKKINQEEN